MILFWFALGIVAITLIARYNESNALFWKLFLAFVLGFAVAKMVLPNHYSYESERNKDTLTQVCPIQALMASSGTTINLLAGVLPEISGSIKSLDPVGKVNTPVFIESGLVSSKVFEGIRGQPHSLNNSNAPPLLYFEFFNTS